MPDTPLQGSARAERVLPKRTQLIVVLVLVAAIVAVFVAPGIVARLRPPKPPESKPKIAPGSFQPTQEQRAALQVSPVQNASFRSEQVTDGRIAFNEDTVTPVFSPYSGRVTRLVAKLGDVVARGSPLMAVEASEFVQAHNDLVSAVSGLNSARAQMRLSESNEQRQHEMYLAKSGALKDWLQSQADLAVAQNNLRNAEIALRSAHSRLAILGKSDAEIAALESSPPGQKTSAEAFVAAPIAGTVTQRQVGLGQYITSAASGASTPVYSISDLSSVWLIANVREIDAPLMRVGQELEVHALAYPGKTFTAKIAWVASSVDPATHRLPVRAVVDNRDGALKPMMFANFSIITGAARLAPAVPQGSVVYEGDQARVYVAKDDGTLALRLVTTGRRNGNMVEVTSGLSAGEKVVTSGTVFIDRAATGAAK